MPTPNLAAAALAASALGALFAAGCTCPNTSKPSAEVQLAMLKDTGYYAEEQNDGRYYVFGNEKTHKAFATSPSIQVAKTFIGQGPGGATVVFEAKDKLPEMTDRLVKTFSEKHGVSFD
jgi:hypothetical protein